MYIIYKITNILDNKIYIGQTTESLQKRFSRHCGYQLNDGTHLHNAMKKYGITNFYIEQIDSAINQEELDEKEIYWIRFYNSCDENIGYNIKNTKGKCGGDTLSKNPNLSKIKEKISESKLGGKNPNSRKVKAINIKSNEERIFDSFSECQRELNIPRHDIIGRRCRKQIKKPYKNEWMFEYID